MTRSAYERQDELLSECYGQQRAQGDIQWETFLTAILDCEIPSVRWAFIVFVSSVPRLLVVKCTHVAMWMDVFYLTAESQE